MMIREKARQAQSGYLMLLVLAVAQLGLAYAIFVTLRAMSISGLITVVLASIVVAIMWAGLLEL